MLFDTTITPPNQEVSYSGLLSTGVQLYIKREDILHPEVSGNKFRKLKYVLEDAQKNKAQTLLTFGGAYSNHILAVAAAGHAMGFKTIGIIRGDELGQDVQTTLAQNPTLRKAHGLGMQFQFVSRSQYREKDSPEFLESLSKRWGDFYAIPEGGTNALAIQGCREILTQNDAIFDYICVSVGTGGTISGLIKAAKEHQKVIGFAALKGDFLQHEIEQWVAPKMSWEVNTQFHFGGYAQYTPELIHFMNSFFEETGILLDPIYTAKMLFGIVTMAQQHQFKKGSRILAIHTGGIQGIEGMNTRLKAADSKIVIHT